MYFEAIGSSFYTQIIEASTGTGHLPMILAGENSGLQVDKLRQELNKAGVTFCGGIFPKVINKNSCSDRGVVVKMLPVHNKPLIISTRQPLDENWLAAQGFPLNDSEPVSYITWLSEPGIASNSFLKQLQQVLPHLSVISGGGAGYSTFEKKPCIFNNEGFYEQGALVIPVAMNCDICARHGFGRLYGPVLATRAESNLLAEINWEPACELYQKILKDKSDTQIDTANFYQDSKFYPFGIVKEGYEDIVRDPAALNEQQHISFFGEIPKNASLYILKSDRQPMIDAAAEAARKVASRQAREVLMICCVSRAFIMQEEYVQELQAIEQAMQQQGNSATVEGVLSIGEVASLAKGTIEFFNKTVVACNFRQGQ